MITITCEGCMAFAHAGTVTKECKRLIRQGVCQKQIALKLASMGQPIDGEVVVVEDETTH